MDKKKSQCKKIVEHLNKYNSITGLEAQRRYGIMRLASRISDLKRDGYIIESAFVTVKNRDGEDCRVKSYWLGGEDVSV